MAGERGVFSKKRGVSSNSSRIVFGSIFVMTCCIFMMREGLRWPVRMGWPGVGWDQADAWGACAEGRRQSGSFATGRVVRCCQPDSSLRKQAERRAGSQKAPFGMSLRPYLYPVVQALCARSSALVHLPWSQPASAGLNIRGTPYAHKRLRMGRGFNLCGWCRKGGLSAEPLKCVLKNRNLAKKNVVLRLNEFGESGLAAGATTPDVHKEEVDRFEGFCEP